MAVTEGEVRLRWSRSGVGSGQGGMMEKMGREYGLIQDRRTDGGVQIYAMIYAVIYACFTYIQFKCFSPFRSLGVLKKYFDCCFFGGGGVLNPPGSAPYEALQNHY